MFVVALSASGVASAQDWCSRYSCPDGFEGGATATWVHDTYDAIWGHGFVTVGNDSQRRSGNRDAKLFFDQGDSRGGGMVNVSKTYDVALAFDPNLNARNTSYPSCPTPAAVPPNPGVISSCSVNFYLRATNANPTGSVYLTTPFPGVTELSHLNFALSDSDPSWHPYTLYTPDGVYCRKINVQFWLIQPYGAGQRPEVAIDDVKVNWYFKP